MKVGIIGAGERGRIAYARELNKYEEVEIVAAVEWNQEKLKLTGEEFGIDQEYLFDNADDFFKKMDENKFVDALVIATYDREHYDITMKALDYDVDILLEKPISPNADEVFNIAKKAEAKDNVFMICHVLRYAPFYTKIKEVLDSGAIGKVININHNENIGYFHFAHSFVRGNWRNEEESSPLILQKSCHDMDILLYFLGLKPKSISSVGNLTYFVHENQPEGASDRCLSCKYQDECIYSTKNFYRQGYRGYGWRNLVDPSLTEEGLIEALENGPYGRCVWACDNTVCDHQATTIEFENDVTAVFNLSAFAKNVHRNIKIQGTKGELIADDHEKEIIIKTFGSSEERVIKVQEMNGGHGGGDYAIIKAFMEGIKGDKDKIKTGASESVMSHLMCFAAEESRKNNKLVNMEEYIGELDGKN